MSDNEIDQIARDTGRMFRQILDVGHAYIARRRGVNRAGAVRRLSRDERRELAQQIRTDVGEERIAQTWFTQRVEDYRRETIASRHRISRGADNDVESARLDSMRYSIESTMGGTVLSEVQRGQIVSAMDRCNSGHADRPFYRPELFRQRDGRDAVQLREAAARSQRWVSDRRAAVERLLPEHAEAAAREAEFRTADPERAERQAWAIQDLRHVEAVSREFGDTRRVRSWRSTAHDRARAVGLSAEQVKWEVTNAEANSRVQVTVKAARDGSSRFSDWSWHGYFPEEVQAAAWTRDLADDHDWRPGTVLTAKARENGRDKPFYAIEGNQVEVARDAELWHSEARDGFIHTRHNEQNQDQARTQQQAERPATVSEQPQPAEPQRPVEAQPKQAPTDLVDRVRAQRDRLRGQVDDLRNERGELAGKVDALSRRLEAVERQDGLYKAERDEALGKVEELTERLEAVERQNKQYKAERDEAVQKLAKATPRSQRFGSKERIAAEQARSASTETDSKVTADGRMHVEQQVGVRIHNGHIVVDADNAAKPADPVEKAKAQQRDHADQQPEKSAASEPQRPMNAFAAAAAAHENGHERGGFER